MTREFYTYIHARPSGEPFYVGKGFDGKKRRRSHDFIQRTKFHRYVVAKHGRENIIITVLPMATEEDAQCLKK